MRVLIMGGSSGIGAATAARFARAGADVVITGRNQDRLDATAGSIDGQVSTARLDSAAQSELAAFFAPDTEYDVLVLALSGASGGGPFADLDLAAVQHGFDGKFWPQELR